MPNNDDQYVGGQIPGISPAPQQPMAPIPPPAPMSGVARASSELDAALTSLDKRLGELNKVLGYASRPNAGVAPDVKQAEPPAPATSPLVRELQQFKRHVIAMTDKGGRTRELLDL